MPCGLLLLIFALNVPSCRSILCGRGHLGGDYLIIPSSYTCKFNIYYNGTTKKLANAVHQSELYDTIGCFFHPLYYLGCSCDASYCNIRMEIVIRIIEEFRDTQPKKVQKVVTQMLDYLRRLERKQESDQNYVGDHKFKDTSGDSDIDTYRAFTTPMVFGVFLSFILVGFILETAKIRTDSAGRRKGRDRLGGGEHIL